MQSKTGNNPTQSSTGRRLTRGARLRSLIRKNLVANPDFPRIYAEILESEGHNFNEAKDLAIQLQKKLGVYKPQRSVQTCTHIMVTGVACQSPALRGEQFCYFHQRMLQGVALPRTQFNHMALLENEEAIQVSLMQVMNALMTGSIDVRRGELILRALNTAVRNSRRVRFNVNADKMVTEVPHYEQEEKARQSAREQIRAEAHRMRDEARQIAQNTTGQSVRTQPSAAQPSAAQASERKSPAEPDVTQPKAPLGIKASAEVTDRRAAARAASS